jgi:hypothetical protein
MALDRQVDKSQGLVMRDLARSLAARGARLSLLVTAIAAAATLAGCAGNPDDTANLRQQAQAALTRWADAVAAAGGPPAVVPVGELTKVGDWEVAVGDNNKPALMGGLVEAGVSLPAEVPPDGNITWQDGKAATVSLLSAEQAVAAIRAGTEAPCGECTALRITGARLTTGPIETSRGPATAPLWEFTIDGTAVKVTHLAIANRVTVAPPPWDPSDPPGGVWIDSGQGAVSGRELTVAFVGAPRPGDQPCGEDYTTEAVESDLAVVVIVVRHPHLTIGGGCTAVGAMRTATVELAAPLGDRAVLQVQDGTPVPITLTP